MLSTAFFRNTITTISVVSATSPKTRNHSRNKLSIRLQTRCFLKPEPTPISIANGEIINQKSTVALNSLRVLEWDKLCEIVSSFARTSLGREAIKKQLWSLNQTYEESLRLLEETNAAVEINKYSNASFDFNGFDVLLVKSAIRHAQRGLPLGGKEAVSVAGLLQFADKLQLTIKSATKENADMYKRFMPLFELISQWVVNRSLAKLIIQVVDEDGAIKDSASPKLKQARRRVEELERKLFQVINNLITEDKHANLEMNNTDGRWCIRSIGDHPTGFNGLLLSSGSRGSIVEPLSAVPLNDELQQAKAFVSDAEEEVLLQLTEKIQMDLANVENLLNSVVQLDAVNARATYSLSFGGVCPDLLLLEDQNDVFSAEAHLYGNGAFDSSTSSNTERKLYLPQAYHPLILQQHRHKLQKAQKDLANATAEIRRRRLQEAHNGHKEEIEVDLAPLESKVNELLEAHPVPVDFVIDKKTRVLLITGPNTGGKTICLKTVALAAMMAKSGLYTLCSEPAQIPCFDVVFADIGDEQSLSQSLSTFSGHLKQISGIIAESTSQSLVLLDEVGAGTNPLEGAALGMSILESFAKAGALLTIATTHHGELKTLKYSNEAFENACMEFDDVKLKPTYKVLWGIPGRSNAINIAERLGLPKVVIDHARELYGKTNVEIDETLLDMEQFKQNVQEHIQKARHYLKLSKDLSAKLLNTERKLAEHKSNQSYRKMEQLSKISTKAHTILRKKTQQHRASIVKVTKSITVRANNHQTSMVNNQQYSADNSEGSAATKITSPFNDTENPSTDSTQTRIPKVGDLVYVSSLGTRGKVLQVEASKEEIVVQAGLLKLKLKLIDVKI